MTQDEKAYLNIDEVMTTISHLFDADFYLTENPDVSPEFINPLLHYAQYGWREGRRPYAGFSPRLYLLVIRGSVEIDADPLCQAVRNNHLDDPAFKLGLDESILAAAETEFDSAWYDLTYPDVRDSHYTPLYHYITTGWREGKDPSPNFSTSSYLVEHPEILMLNADPLTHRAKLLTGTKGDNSGTLPTSVSAQSFDSNSNALEIFDPEFYKKKYPDIVAAGLDPSEHYFSHGWNEGRWPTSWFDSRFYLEANDDVRGAEINPFIHYIASGRDEGRLPARGGTVEGFLIGQDFRKHSFTLSLAVRRAKRDTVEDAVTSTTRPTILVHLHCYYKDQIFDCMRLLNRIPEAFDLVITTPFADAAPIVEHYVDSHAIPLARSIDCIICPNRGRDIGPWLAEVLPKATEYEVGLHFHTKKSVEKGPLGAEWSHDLLSKLLLDDIYIKSQITILRNSDVGLLYPQPFAPIVPQMKWGSNKRLAAILLKRIFNETVILPEALASFPAGMMFWYKPAALAPLNNLGLSYEDFPPEPILDDGTVAHALERILPEVVRRSGFLTANVRPAQPERTFVEEVVPVISVIVPAFNAADWIIECIESIRDQLPDTPPFEIIVVDDFSTDETSSLLSVYGEMPLISVLKSKGSGAGAARNTGLDEAKGDFVVFVDADDLITRDALSCLYTEANTRAVDLVVSQLVMFTESRTSDALPSSLGIAERHVPMSRLFSIGSDYPIEAKLGRSLQWLLHDFGPCAKIYRKQYLDDNQIRFPEGLNFEDNYFIYKCYLAARDIRILDRVTYLYRKSDLSDGFTQSTVRSEKAFLDQMTVIGRIIGEQVSVVTNTTLREMAGAALSKKLAQTLVRFPEWSNVDAMRGSAMTVVSALKALKSEVVTNHG